MDTPTTAMGFLHCPTDITTLNAITLVGGLLAEPTNQAGYFQLRPCLGAVSAPVANELWLLVQEELDRAVADGILFSWEWVAPLPSGLIMLASLSIPCAPMPRGALIALSPHGNI